MLLWRTLRVVTSRGITQYRNSVATECMHVVWEPLPRSNLVDRADSAIYFHRSVVIIENTKATYSLNVSLNKTMNPSSTIRVFLPTSNVPSTSLCRDWNRRVFLQEIPIERAQRIIHSPNVHCTALRVHSRMVSVSSRYRRGAIESRSTLS
jgi:hypothetical protein